MPEQAPTSTLAVPSRRERFRAYMQRFNPIAPAQKAIVSGLVVENLHRDLYRKLAARADLEPGSQQLLVGGIGSGKTTELMLADKWLAAQEKTLPLYIDITAETDLAALNSGALLAAFGLHLTLRARPEVKDPAFQKVLAFAFGEARVAEASEVPEVREVPACYVRGKLHRPFPPLQRDVGEIRDPLETLLGMLRKSFDDVVVICMGWAVRYRSASIGFTTFRRLRENTAGRNQC